jgi:AraC-like DNA-binding protein
MWRAFTQRLGVTPAAYRQRFAAAPTRPAAS